MTKLQLENIKPIEGFKVMEWLRAVREKQHRLYEQDPEAYYKQLEQAGKRMKRRLSAKERARKLSGDGAFLPASGS
jgi:hypothetical protein